VTISQSKLEYLLARNDDFTDRVQVSLCRIAAQVMTESGVGATHVARAAYARNVLQSPGNVAAAASIYLAQSTNVRGSITMEDSGAQTTVDDAALESQIFSDWNLLAGIDQGS
jgi:hypothetical protein